MRNLLAFLKFYKDILNDSGLDYVIFGHIGDCHLHANLLPKNDVEAEKARHIYGRCIREAVTLGGVVSAEHGIGKLKAKYLNVMMGERYINEMVELKRVRSERNSRTRKYVFDGSASLPSSMSRRRRTWERRQPCLHEPQAKNPTRR